MKTVGSFEMWVQPHYMVPHHRPHKYKSSTILKQILGVFLIAVYCQWGPVT
jgi:hypothetical protein